MFAGSGLSLRQKLVKWINPDATEVALPNNEEKPYFDKEQKVWVFPGDDPQELAKPVGPPPMTPTASMPEPTPEPEMSNDPLAALMAPPNSRRGPSSSNRPGAVGGMDTPRGYPGTRSPAGGPPGMASPAAAGAPPQFAIFQPKPAAKDEKKSG